jgi:hypothetical protein
MGSTANDHFQTERTMMMNNDQAVQAMQTFTPVAVQKGVYSESATLTLGALKAFLEQANVMSAEHREQFLEQLYVAMALGKNIKTCTFKQYAGRAWADIARVDPGYVKFFLFGEKSEQFRFKNPELADYLEVLLNTSSASH